MKLLILTVLLAVSQTSAPIPRKTTDSAARTTQNIQNQTKDNQKTSTPIPLFRDKEAAPTTDTNGNAQNPKNTEQSIRITELPAVSVNNSGIDWRFWILNGLLVFVGCIQAVALFLTVFAIKRQGKIMENQVALTQPRLHIDGVRARWLRQSEQPIFFVKIMNSGIIAAENVAIKIKIELAGSVIQYACDQIITIPANEMRECPIPSRTTINEALSAGLESGSALLRVSGHITWGKQDTKYCYKYYPWPSNMPRPKGLPSFVPCDFDTNITADVTVPIEGNAAVIATLGTTPSTPK